MKDISLQEYDELDSFAERENNSANRIFDSIQFDGRGRKIEAGGRVYEVRFHAQNRLPVYSGFDKVGEFRYSAETACGKWYFCA